MAGYDNGVWESGNPSADPASDPDPERRRRLQDPNQGWHATGVDGGAVVSNQFAQDVDRYRQIGHNETQRGPVQLNQGPAQQSRGLQMGALGLLQAQAGGWAPSSAQILSQRGNENAVRGAGRQVAGARGPGAAVAAFGGANDAASQQALASNVQGAQNRAGEVSRGQGAFTAGAGVMRGQDLGAATTNAQLDAQNRELAERQQQHYERMAFDTKNQEMRAANEAAGQEQQRQADLRRDRSAEAAAGWQKGKELLGAIPLVGSAAAAGAGAAGGNDANDRAKRDADTADSDPRAKMNVGSLAHLMRRVG